MDNTVNSSKKSNISYPEFFKNFNQDILEYSILPEQYIRRSFVPILEQQNDKGKVIPLQALSGLEGG
jgi:hypothetical protein